jgi:mono/diheme cytochrome c family protein
MSGLVAAQNSSYRPDPKWKVPAAKAAKKNPFAKDASAAKKGRDLFDAQCSMCHGVDGRGIANAANFHTAAVQRESDGTLFWRITKGNQNKGMPPFKHLSEQERWQLVSFIRTLKDKGGAK